MIFIKILNKHKQKMKNDHSLNNQAKKNESKSINEVYIKNRY